MDIDLAGQTSNELDHIAELFGKVCKTVVEPDGIEFNPSSIEVSRIKEDAQYEGARVRFLATLAKARVPMQIDIGFGDVTVPPPVEIEYPTLLDFPAPAIRAYSKETVIAEKLEALTILGLLNSRLKDYYDLAILARMYAFEGSRLNKAIKATFHHRGTAIASEPIGLSITFRTDPARAIQWRAFLKRSRFSDETQDFQRIVSDIRLFVLPVLTAASANKEFDAHWRAGTLGVRRRSSMLQRTGDDPSQNSPPASVKSVRRRRL